MEHRAKSVELRSRRADTRLHAPRSPLHPPVRLGRFTLQFAGGKLEQLTVDETIPLLHTTDYLLPLETGRTFSPSGWDECFPTIDATATAPTMGWLIATAPAQTVRDGRVTQTWHLPACEATRTFSVDAAGRLEVRFEAHNRTSVPLPFLWASHALFNVADVTEMMLPDGSALREFAVNGTCEKRFLRAAQPIRIRKQAMVLALETDQPFWGLWLNRGGWPADRPAGFCCIGIEATSAPSETPTGRQQLAPNNVFTGEVWLGVSA